MVDGWRTSTRRREKVSSVFYTISFPWAPDGFRFFFRILFWILNLWMWSRIFRSFWTFFNFSSLQTTPCCWRNGVQDNKNCGYGALVLKFGQNSYISCIMLKPVLTSPNKLLTAWNKLNTLVSIAKINIFVSFLHVGFTKCHNPPRGRSDWDHNSIYERNRSWVQNPLLRDCQIDEGDWRKHSPNQSFTSKRNNSRDAEGMVIN